MNCRGLHCPGCHRGGPGAPLTALLILLAIGAAIRALESILPLLLHLLIAAAITATAAAAVITAAALAVRRTARPDRTARRQLRRPPTRVIRDAASDRRGLPAPPRPRSLPAPTAVQDAAPPPAPHQASGRTPPP
jgi:hypothetical protein